jgi:hypothetical protein
MLTDLLCDVVMPAVSPDDSGKLVAAPCPFVLPIETECPFAVLRATVTFLSLSLGSSIARSSVHLG